MARASSIGRAAQPSAGSHAHPHEHGHSHGLVDDSVKRSREGLCAVGWSLLILGATAAAQAAIFLVSGSVALFADLIHNLGDAATAFPLGVAFLFRSARGERLAGLAVVAAIFFSACVAGYESVDRLIHPEAPDQLVALGVAGALGFVGNSLAAIVRTRAGRRIDSPALIADGDHARADAFVSLGVVASAAAVAVGLDVADPLIGLLITSVILRITWQSWKTIHGGGGGHEAPDTRWRHRSRSPQEGQQSPPTAVSSTRNRNRTGRRLKMTSPHDSPGVQERTEGAQLPTAAEEEARRNRLKLVALAGAVATLVAVSGLAWLFGPGSSDPAAPANTGSLSTVDGTLIVVEDRRLVMRTFQPLDGQSEVEFTIREQDVDNFDIAHLQSHSSVALPTRLYYEKSGENYFAVYKEDAPANSETGG